jgi:transposase
MLHIQLTPEQETELIQITKDSPDRHFRQRAQAVLMAARHRPREHTAQDLDVSPRSVQRWLNAFLHGGLLQLKPQWGPGRAPLIPQERASQIIQWVKQGPSGCGLNRANWTYFELADHLRKTTGICVGETTMRQFCHRHDIKPYRPTYRFLRGDEQKQQQARQELAELKAEAVAGNCVLLSQDEARFPMVPTLLRTLGVKGFRPVVGTWDCKDLVYSFGALNLVDGKLTTRLLDSPKAQRGRGKLSKTRRMQDAFARHIRDMGRAYPASVHPRVVVTIDNAPWHRGQVVDQALADNPHVELYRLPSYSPQLNVIERLWRLLRRRATHNRLFETMQQLKEALRASFCYFQTLRHRMLSLITSPRNRTKSAAA